MLSWLELGNVYLAQCDYLAASHCFEELILLNPECANYHNKLADVYYTIGMYLYIYTYEYILIYIYILIITFYS